MHSLYALRGNPRNLQEFMHLILLATVSTLSRQIDIYEHKTLLSHVCSQCDIRLFDNTESQKSAMLITRSIYNYKNDPLLQQYGLS